MPRVKKRIGILPKAKSSGARPQQQKQQQAPAHKPANSTKPGVKRPSGTSDDHPAPKRQRHEPQQAQQWYCRSVIDRQAADAVAKLVHAAETHQSGATIKSLTLAPHIVHKKATFAVTCQTLKCMGEQALMAAWLVSLLQWISRTIDMYDTHQ